MATDLAVLDAVESSNLRPEQKLNLIRFYGNKLRGSGSNVLARVKATAQGSAHVLRQSGESVVVGGGLGALHAHLPTGLDVAVGTRSVPVDAVVAAVGIGGSLAFAHESMSDDLRNAGVAALTVLTFRKTHDFAAKRLAAQGVTPGSSVAAASAGAPSPSGGVAPAGSAVKAHGDMGYDPIVELARRL